MVTVHVGNFPVRCKAIQKPIEPGIEPMKIKSIFTAIALMSIATIGFAQEGAGCGGGGASCSGGSGAYGGTSYMARGYRMHPRPVYAHSRAGRLATNVHEWNQMQMQTYSWHGPYSYHVYGRPTALVVPPTASFQTVYSWGVGNTQSIPIHHQFGAYGGTVGGGPNYPATPYWPSSTQQFGIYPVRSPW